MTTDVSPAADARTGPLGGPRIEKVVVRNYRCLSSTSVTLNRGLNIIVGDNEAGKSTLLEAIHLGLTCQLHGRNLRNQLHPHLFNEATVAAFCSKVNAGEKAPAPEILIELCTTLASATGEQLLDANEKLDFQVYIYSQKLRNQTG